MFRVFFRGGLFGLIRRLWSKFQAVPEVDTLSRDTLLSSESAVRNSRSMHRNELASVEPPAPDSEPISGAPAEFQPIPAEALREDNSNFSRAWKPLLTLEYAYWPSFVDFDALPKSPDQARRVKIDELNESVLYVQNYVGSQLVPFNVLYTDPRLLKSGTFLRQGSPRHYLEHVLYDPNTWGVAFNPLSRVTNPGFEGDVTYLYKDGIPEVIGYLDVLGNEEPKHLPYHQLVLQAEAHGKPYEALYYWTRSYRTPRDGDDWSLVYMEKLRVYWELDYPGSRDKAVAGLKWFLENHGQTPERMQLFQSWTRR